MCKERFLSLLLVVAAGFLLLLSLVVSAVIAAAGRMMGPNLPIPEAWLHVLTFVVSFFVITFLFGAIYKVIPDVNLGWRDVAVGAAVTSLIFTIGKQLIALYLGKAALGSTYGAAGSLVVLLVWMYYSAQLVFLGAEFTKVYAEMYGSHPGQVPPARPANVPAETKGQS
jgi:membrane protein